jgi:hypothetical protein
MMTYFVAISVRYAVMLSCWNANPRLRPSFLDLQLSLTNMQHISTSHPESNSVMSSSSLYSTKRSTVSQGSDSLDSNYIIRPLHRSHDQQTYGFHSQSSAFIPLGDLPRTMTTNSRMSAARSDHTSLGLSTFSQQMEMEEEQEDESHL